MLTTLGLSLEKCCKSMLWALRVWRERQQKWWVAAQQTGSPSPTTPTPSGHKLCSNHHRQHLRDKPTWAFPPDYCLFKQTHTARITLIHTVEKKRKKQNCGLWHGGQDCINIHKELWYTQKHSPRFRVEAEAGRSGNNGKHNYSLLMNM